MCPGAKSPMVANHRPQALLYWDSFAPNALLSVHNRHENHGSRGEIGEMHAHYTGRMSGKENDSNVSVCCPGGRMGSPLNTNIGQSLTI